MGKPSYGVNGKPHWSSHKRLRKRNHSYCIHVLPWQPIYLQKPWRKSEGQGQIACPRLLSMKSAWLDQQTLTSSNISSSWQQVICRPDRILTPRQMFTLSLTLLCTMSVCAHNKWMQDVDLQMWQGSKLVTTILESAVFQGKQSPMRRPCLERWAVTK